MKPRHLLFLTVMLLAGVLVAQTPAAETDQLKADLVGHSMGGRERCWKFQSRDQIKTLSVKSRSEDTAKRVVTVSLRLEADQSCGAFNAEARLEYAKENGAWKLRQVGLLSLAKAN